MGTSAIERQAKDYGYAVEVKVDTNDMATVTLKATYGESRTFSATSGDDRSSGRYESALRRAMVRMLDFEHRSGERPRPKLGRNEWDGLPGDWREPEKGDGDPDFQGGIGCAYCDSLWATAESMEAHQRRMHADEPAGDADERKRLY